tara:strand:+ start:1153 stop:1704 length:552 start_codon:yes stop_codon:yes gene_type:complete
MELQEWIDGAFTETDTDYQIAGKNILYKNEEEFLIKGVELLCDKINPSSVLEFGFGKGWTATEFQRKGVTRHVILEPNKEVYQMALTWKNNYNTNIEILNIFSWDYNTSETFDLVYDDREPITSSDDDDHFDNMSNILPSDQLYAFNSHVACGDNFGESIEYTLSGVKYRQGLTRGFYPYGNS